MTHFPEIVLFQGLVAGWIIGRQQVAARHANAHAPGANADWWWGYIAMVLGF